MQAQDSSVVYSIADQCSTTGIFCLLQMFAVVLWLHDVVVYLTQSVYSVAVTAWSCSKSVNLLTTKMLYEIRVCTWSCHLNHVHCTYFSPDCRRATSMELPMGMRFRHVKTNSRQAAAVYRSSIHGRGLFCKRTIDSGEMVSKG